MTLEETVRTLGASNALLSIWVLVMSVLGGFFLSSVHLHKFLHTYMYCNNMFNN